jgi:hypothetical protein
MDPISLITAALIAGASAGAKDAATSAVKDAYAGLRRLIERRLGSRADAVADLDRLEADSDADHSALLRRLAAAGAADDKELLAAATAVLQRADPAGAAAGKYAVVIQGGKGIAIGEGQTVDMTFND